MGAAQPRRSPGLKALSLRRFQGNLGDPERDLLVVEEPLEIRYAHRAVATLMRTPGDDRDLALGYLYGEGWIHRPADVGALSLCAGPAEGAGPGDSGQQNVADLIPAPGSRPAPDVSIRLGPATSSCGVCGKRSIEDAMILRPPAAVGEESGSAPPLRGAPGLEPATLATLPDRLRSGQKLFSKTGSLHAAGVFEAGGELLNLREDIGRHNAVDKVIGDAFRRDLLPLSSHALQVSGRVSFEIVQKAYRAGIAVVCAVSGVSTLAVEFSRRAGITLAGFVRDGRFCVYSHPERLGTDAREAADGEDFAGPAR